MKKSYLFRNFLLPLLAALAVMFAGACSQEGVESENLMPRDMQTRANISGGVTLTSDPAGTGADGEYYAINKGYNFRISAPETIDGNYRLLGTSIATTAIEGRDDAIEVLLWAENARYIRFTAPGVYRIDAEAQYTAGSGLGPVIVREASLTCRAVPAVSGIDGPGSVVLGEVYDFKVNFEDPAYAGTDLIISESVFNDPQYTVVSNDGAGNYRIRFDQPGDYTIAFGVKWENTPNSASQVYMPYYRVKTFFRPVMNAVHLGFGAGGALTAYNNFIFLADEQQNTYQSLPFRVYFKYKMQSVAPEIGIMSADEGTEVRKSAGEFGQVDLPQTFDRFEGLYYAGNAPSIPGRYWEITIPRDTCYYRDGSEPVLPPVVISPVEPDEPVVIGPGKPIKPLE